MVKSSFVFRYIVALLAKVFLFPGVPVPIFARCLPPVPRFYCLPHQ
jgi:hypothetical protein